MPLSDNALLTAPRRFGDMVQPFGFIRKGAMLAAVDRVTKAFDVRKAEARSGGGEPVRAATCRSSLSAAKSCASRACWWCVSRPGASMPARPR